MLKDLKLQNTSNAILDILSILNKKNPTENRVKAGIYEIGHFNLDQILLANGYKFYRSWDDEIEGMVDEDLRWNLYGVCDNYQQILDKFPQIETDKNNYVISLTKIVKSLEPESYGWRWHKWGHYIGTKNPQHEYIYNEDDSIEEVYCYHIYVLKD